MLVLTGATGFVGSVLLKRLNEQGRDVRCLVRDPRMLGDERVRSKLSIADLLEPASYRHALKGAKTVVHLAGGRRDQDNATVEELTTLATWNLLRAAEKAGVEHFIFFTVLGAGQHERTRLQRAKAVAEEAVTQSHMRTTTIASSIIYARNDRRFAHIERLAALPAVPTLALGDAYSQPIWVRDAVDCTTAVLDQNETTEQHQRIELAGGETLPNREFIELALKAMHRNRRVVQLPDRMAKPLARAYEALAGQDPLVTWEDAELFTISTLAARGAKDAEALGVHPRSVASVLGLE